MTSTSAHVRALVVAPLYHPDRGGLGRQAVLLSEGLSALGVEVSVATRAMTGLPAYAFAPEVERIELPAGRPDVHNYESKSLTNLATSLRFASRLSRLLVARRRRYDLVHFHGASLPLLSALPVLAGLGKRVVAKVAALHQGVEAGDLRGHYGPLGPLLAGSLRRVDAFVATTAEIEQALVAEGYRPERIARISNFVETSRFAPPSAEARAAARASLGWSERRVLLHAGRLTERKACDVLLRAFARALPGVTPGPRPLLALVGDGPQRGALEALARALGLGEHVVFPGFQEDVVRYLHACDGFVLASRIEGLPNALLEAMACGCPVLATRIGGSLEAIASPEQGLIVPVDDVEALGAGLARLLDDAPLRARLGAGAAQRIRERFTLEATVPRYLELYRRLLAGRPPRGV